MADLASSPTLTSRGRTPSSTRTSPKTRKDCARSSASSRSPAASRRTSRRRHRARSTKAASSGTLSHAFGAAFDNPELIVACVVGDGEAETGPLATGWHGNKFLNPARDGAVLPILHLKGYKIANPCFLARIPEDELRKFFEGMGYAPLFVTGHEPAKVHQQLAAALDSALAEIKRIRKAAREQGSNARPAWPMIVMRPPKGWTCPAEIDGKKCEDYWRAHQVPMSDMDKPEHVQILEGWMKSYRPEELFDAAGQLRPELAALAPAGHRR